MNRENKEIFKTKDSTKIRDVIIEGGTFDKDVYFNIIQGLFEDMLFSLNIKTRELTHNGARAAEFGLPPVVKNFPMSMVNEGVIYPDDLATFMAYSYDMLAGNGGSHEVRIRGIDGTFQWFSVKTTALKDEHGVVIEVLGRIRNIQEEKEVQVRAMTDPLTKTQNRLTFEENVNFIINNSKEGDEHAFFFIDLDDFKIINDTYGHKYGDFILSSLADRIKNRVQKSDFVGRVGGDEFVVFMKGISGIEKIEKRANQLLQDLRSEYCDGDNTHMVRVSIGVARYPLDAKNYDELYDVADKALYHAKGLGKNTASIYNVDM